MATDFSSLDKLIEFGMGIGIANQMMNTMNRALAQTAIPGVGINPGVCEPCVPSGHAKQYFIVKEEQLAGPLNEKELKDLIRKEIVKSNTFCWYSGLHGWRFASDIPEVNKLLLLNS